MPNHVTNVLRVSGDPEQVRAMFEAIKDDIYVAILYAVNYFSVIP